MESDAHAPVEPRKSASLLVVRDEPLQVLLLERHSSARFPSQRVFPGGVLEVTDRDPAWDEWAVSSGAMDADERAIRIAGIRETWEESGLLVASGGASPVSSRDLPFIDVVRATGHPLALDDLVDFAHWITPLFHPRRFDTRFYLVRAPHGQEAAADGGEMVAHEWVAPGEARTKFGGLLPPTHFNFLRLAESATVDEAFAAAASRPRFTVLPIRATLDGGLGVRIPAEAGYGATEYVYGPYA